MKRPPNKPRQPAPGKVAIVDTLSARSRHSDLDAQLAALADLGGPELRQRWAELVGEPVPRVRPRLLRVALAWELQAAVHGGLSRAAREALIKRVAGPVSTVRLAPGTRLAREWNGVLHTVTIGEDGAVHWDGRQWNSISAAARAITGTRWSGPVFFGLDKQQGAA